MSEYRYVGDHPDTLANGRPVAPGEFVQLSDQEAIENQELKLLKIEGKAAGRHSAVPADEAGEES